MNRGEIKTAVRGLGYAGDIDAALDSAINDVNRRVHARKRWPWTEVHATGTLAFGSEIVTIAATNILHVDSVRVEAPNDYGDLAWEEPQELRRLLHLDRSMGYPEKWTKHAGDILVWPRAQNAMTVTVDYVRSVPDLAADADVPLPPSSYHDLYTWGAASILAMRERDWSAVGAFSVQYRDRVQEMEQELGVRQRQTARQVQRPTWYRDF